MLQRLYQIDFLKFVFACMIMFYHLAQLLSSCFPNVPEYALLSNRTDAVGGEITIAFFVLSGYFLCRTSLSKPYDIKNFIAKRIKRLYPLLIFSFIPIFLLGMFNVYDFLNILFMTDGMGILNAPSNNAATWFVCVLFWLSIFFYCLLHQYKAHILPICGLFTFFGFVWLAKASDTYYAAVALPTLQLTAGMLRGIIGMSLGIIIYFITEQTQKNIALKSSEIIFSLLEFYLFYFTIYYTCCHSVFCQDIFYQIILCGLIVSFLLNKGYVSLLLNNKFFKMFGGWSYGIYVMHFPTFQIFKRYVWPKNFISSPVSMLIICSLICIFVGIFSVIICNGLMKKFDKVKKYGAVFLE